jgi:hypothetical protein
VRTIDLQLAARPLITEPLRSATGAPAVELEAPDFGEETGQVLLSADEWGVMRWHYPEPTGGGAAATRGGTGRRMRYRIDAPVFAPSSDMTGTRSLLGAIGRKVLKLLVYPITDPIVGAVVEHLAERWEARKRPYRLRDFAPASYAAPDGVEIEPGDAERLGAGRVLLFIHGTFSTAHGAFGDLPPALMQDLHTRYGGRVIAFDHHTLSHDPLRNATELLGRLPAPLEVDVVCHSRGGLIARMLAEKPSSFGLDSSALRVRRVVFVGVPNAGTQLADPTHMTHFLDRMTSALNLFPFSGVTDVLEGIITAVKIVGRGALHSLDGLVAMNPDGPFLRTLNSGSPSPGVEYYAIAADYEPENAGLKALLLDGAVDRVFRDVPNDLVVPLPGVFQPAMGGTPVGGFFPVDQERCLLLGSDEQVTHTRMFAHEGTRARVSAWLD